MTEHRITSQHTSWLAKRKVLEAAYATGVHSGTDRGGADVINIPYGNGWMKTYAPGSNDPWRQVKPKNTRLPIWRLNQIDFSKRWILTEGEWDALAAYQSGHTNVGSLPDGAIQPAEDNPHKSGKIDCIRAAWDKIGKSSAEIVLALDNDDPGHVTRDTLIDIFGRWRCSEVQYPRHEQATGMDSRCKDLNEVLLLFGKDALEKIIADAKPLKLEGVFKPSQISRGQPRVYYDLGIQGLERHLSLFRGELCVMTGITGHGKTTFLLNVLGQLAHVHSLQVGLGTFEADFWEDVHPWYETWLYGDCNPKPETAYRDTTAWLEENFTIISHQVEPLTKQADIGWFLQQAYDAKGRYGIDVLVLDPWNKVQHKRGHGENESDYIGRTLAEMRNFATVTNTICIVTAHPTKLVFKEDGKTRMPNEATIHGSMNWGNACDHLVTVYRPDKEKMDCCVAVQKSRFRNAGVEGKCWFVYSSRTNKYSKLAEHLWPQE